MVETQENEKDYKNIQFAYNNQLIGIKKYWYPEKLALLVFYVGTTRVEADTNISELPGTTSANRVWSGSFVGIAHLVYAK